MESKGEDKEKRRKRGREEGEEQAGMGKKGGWNRRIEGTILKNYCFL